jgi:hypothetical protein
MIDAVFQQIGVKVVADLVVDVLKTNRKKLLARCYDALRQSGRLARRVGSRRVAVCILILEVFSGQNLSPHDSGVTVSTNVEYDGLSPERLARLPFPPHPCRSAPMPGEGGMIADDGASREKERPQPREELTETVPATPEPANEAASPSTVAEPEPKNAPVVITAKADEHTSPVVTIPVTLRIEVVTLPQPQPAPSSTVSMTYDPNQIALVQPVPVRVIPVLLTQPRRWWQPRR